MGIRSASSLISTGGVLGGCLAIATFSFLACGPAPVVVTDANQALLITPKSSASATTTAVPTASAKKDPLLVPDETLPDLPPFQCAPDKQLVMFGQIFCVATEARSWHDAEAACQKIGAHLATMENSSLPNALRQAIVSPIGTDRFWIGLAEPNEGRWLWSNGTPMRFSAFRSGEPNNSGGNEDCAEWLTEDGRWNDVDCFQPRPFLCEAPAVPPGSRAKSLKCDGQLFKIDKTDYCLERPARWDIAQKICVQNGGELAMIDSDAENNTLFKRLGARIPVTNLWIGLNDEAIEGRFQWMSGEVVRTNLWHSGEPNNFQGNEDCVEWVTSDGRWNDRPCTDSLPALCEKPPAIVGK
jgi:Lectin C-type domain